MKTLVIHPDDRTTDFLSTIYSDQPDWTVINYDCSKSFLKSQISAHERIIMLGHGIPLGLLGYSRLVINPNFVYLLRDPNKQYVYIWCNADQFVQIYKLHGFFTGMVISEPQEASWFNIDVTDDEINYSNWLFANSIKNAIDTDNFHQNVKATYYDIDNPVINFNKQRIYFTNKNGI